MAIYSVALLASSVLCGHGAAGSRVNRNRRAAPPMAEQPEALLQKEEQPEALLEKEDSMYCSWNGRDQDSRCPGRGDNALPSGGGGRCTFRYTFHNGNGTGTGAPVVTSGSCSITKADLGAGGHTNQRTRSWVQSLALNDGCEKDDAGHILANNLGGCGKCPINLFPQNLRVNRGQYRLMESAIYDCIDQAPAEVVGELSWKFTYKKPSLQHLRPESYQYNATFSSGPCSHLSKVFQNERWTPSVLAAADEEPWMQIA